MEPIAFVAALQQEARPLLRRVRSAGGSRQTLQKSSLDGFPCWRFNLLGRQCLLILSGVGLMRAVRAVHALFPATRPQLVISFGIAGAPQDDLCVGDVIVAHTVRMFSQGVAGRAQVLVPLSETAQEAAAQALSSRGARFFSGISLTTTGLKAVNLAGLSVQHPVVEMETAGIAQACFTQGVPVLAFRAVSDSIDQPLPFDLEAYLDKNQNLKICRILAGLIRDPSLFGRLNRLRKNSALAAENCTTAMLAALEKHLPSL